MEDDQQQSKGKAPATSHYAKDSWLGGFHPSTRREVRIQEPSTRTGEINVTFKEPVHKILERIKNESYFRWTSKMGGDPARANQNLYCTYHRENGHTTKQCRVFKDHLEQLMKAGHLKEFVVDLKEPREHTPTTIGGYKSYTCGFNWHKFELTQGDPECDFGKGYRGQ